MLNNTLFDSSTPGDLFRPLGGGGGVLALSLLLLLLGCTPIPSVVDRPETSFDIVIYGGSSAGVAAALEGVAAGSSVVLLAPEGRLGGLTTSGLGWTDSGEKAAIGGIARDFYRRVKAHYDQPSAWVHQEAASYSRYRPADDAMWTFEPKVALSIVETMVAEAGIPVRLGATLQRVRRTGGRITSIDLTDGTRVSGRVFIDATYEGDLLAAAGVAFTFGREGEGEFGESLAGIRPERNVHHHRFTVAVDPYRVAGDPASGLLPGIDAGALPAAGTGDDRIQAYCFRVCLTDVPENRIPFEKPADYRPEEYELLLRNFEAGDDRRPLTLDRMPNGKTDTNNKGAVSTDAIGLNRGFALASPAERARITADHERYQRGLLWTLAHHPRVPEKIRAEMSRWGLPADEFPETGGWPPQLYLREVRRMVGERVQTQQHVQNLAPIPDPVGLGSYNIDSHNCRRYITADGRVRNEGDVQVRLEAPYAIGYASLVPRRQELGNLIVPVCVSATHIAYGSIRMEPVFWILGQSAGAAATIAAQEGVAVQEVPYSRLRARLLQRGQVLDWPVSP